ncbi:s phase cyclin A-associated protein in the endoplasmic reticulum [Trichonephila clavipes]|nr:s phase cyclin A-associated protein in the endoplasmic reticulum [Trichonephila clavipes]
MASISTQETIQKVVEEGLEARNLLNFISDGTFEEVILSKKPPVSPRPQSVSPKPASIDPNKNADARILFRSTKRRGVLSRPKSRLRSASAGRNPEKDLRARYWTFLFENLHRAVDEIYQTCEMDESIVESKVIVLFDIKL